MPMATPHDALFKSVFSIPEIAAAELRHLLPVEIVELISWQTLELFEGSSVDEELRQHHSDLLFTVELAGRQALLYFLVEHKSGPEVLTSLQLLVYITRIWRRCRELCRCHALLNVVDNE